MALRDIFWATTESSDEVAAEEQKKSEQRQAEAQASLEKLPTGDPSVLRDCQAHLTAQLDQQNARRASVDSRLGSIVAMASIAAAISFGVLSALLGKEFRSSPADRVGAVLMLYAVSQITRSLIAAIAGLRRRAYASHALTELFPVVGEQHGDYAKRLMASQIAIFEQHNTENADKVTEMEIAHTALRNFVVATMLLTVMLSLQIALADSGPAGPSAPTVTHVLWGPRGTKGDRGDVGPPGPRGPRGPMGKDAVISSSPAVSKP